ncbi:hypothetical protein [Vibrio aquaticus]|nr:hypothetical protein [Vibrio aquaticus]
MSLILSACAAFPALAEQKPAIAESIALPTLAVSQSKQLSMYLDGVECGINEYFVDNPSVSILANGTPLEFSRTCKGALLTFEPVSRSENSLFVEILLNNRNLNLRYMAGARSYAYNDWQLAPVKEALK